MKKLSLLFLVLSQSSYANFKDLAHEFMGTGHKIEIEALRTIHAEEEVKSFKGTKPFYLSSEFSKADSSSDTLSSVTPGSTISNTGSITLGKKFNWGGDLSFSNELASTRYDDIPNAFSYPEKAYEFTQALSYTQDIGADFLGRTFRSTLEGKEWSFKAKEKELDDVKENALHEFYNYYIEAKLAKTIVELSKKALVRAKRRQKNTQKRVRDGLRERVELYQANVALEASKQNLSGSKQRFEMALENLSKSLKRDVLASEVEVYDFDKKITFKKIAGKVATNKTLEVLKARLVATTAYYDSSSYSVFPEIELSGSFATNRINTDRSTAISEGKLNGEHDAWSIGVNISMPLELVTKKAKRAQAHVEKIIAEKDLKKLQRDLEVGSSFLNKRASLIQDDVRSSQFKLVQAVKALKAQNRLYNLGRADLDQVIQSEETQIDSENGFAQNLSNLEKVEANQALIFGQLSDFLL